MYLDGKSKQADEVISSFPNIYETCLTYVDITKQWIRVVPARITFAEVEPT